MEEARARKGYCVPIFHCTLSAMSDFTALHDLVRSRRTHKRFNGDAVPKAQLEQLLELLPWAPCHRMTQPWRAYVLDQQGCATR